jgi:glycosyltransferase involved in cell wall biosynthesis
VGGRAGGGGGVRQFLGLAVNLRELGHEVTLLCHDFDPTPEQVALLGDMPVRAVRHGVVEIPAKQLELSRRGLQGMAEVARLVPEVDVINVHEWPALHAGRLAGKRLEVPFVWTRNDESVFERATIPDETTIVPEHLRGRAMHAVLGIPDLIDARAAAKVIVLDERNARMVRRAFRRSADIAHSGPLPDFFDPPDRAQARARLGVADDEFLATGMGILFPHRRFEDLIDAVALVGDPRLHAHIYGTDHYHRVYADSLAERIAQRGLEGQVHLGRASISHEQLKDMYAAADVFVFPNRRQTWGLAPLEALAAGTPAIVSTGAGVSDVLRGRPGVQIVPQESPEAIAEALRRALAGEAAEGVQETRDWVRDNLHNRAYAERNLEIFQAAIATRRRT